MTTTTWQQVRGSTIGRKALMALSGAGLMLWLVLHLAGNLLVFRGPEVINGYGQLLHDNPLLLWGQRLAVLTLVLIHVVTYVTLERQRRAARPTPYAQLRRGAASCAARSMRYTGPMLLVLLVYHLLHFTWGTVHPDFVVGDVHHNLVRAFVEPSVVLVYVMFMALLAWHLAHGARSLLFSLGWGSERHATLLIRGSRVVAAMVVLAGLAVPVGLLVTR